MDIDFVVHIDHIALKLSHVLRFSFVELNPSAEVVKVVVFKDLDNEVAKEDSDEVEIIAFELVVCA
jgi:hypothetical protein